MMNDARYAVFTALLEALDKEYQQLRRQCADAGAVEEPSLTPLTAAVQDIVIYRQQLEGLRQMELAVLQRTDSDFA